MGSIMSTGIVQGRFFHCIQSQTLLAFYADLNNNMPVVSSNLAQVPEEPSCGRIFVKLLFFQQGVKDHFTSSFGRVSFILGVFKMLIHVCVYFAVWFFLKKEKTRIIFKNYFSD